LSSESGTQEAGLGIGSLEIRDISWEGLRKALEGINEVKERIKEKKDDKMQES
jgi:hypothetical protein